MGKTGWRQVDHNAPCEICHRPRWCTISEDGVVCRCMRIAEGAKKELRDKSGTPYWLHQLAEPSGVLTPKFPVLPDTKERADPETLDKVYQALLGALSLWKKDRQHLGERGLDEETIEAGGYRSYPLEKRWYLAQSLYERFGPVVLGVPGFIHKTSSRGMYLTLAGSPGILIPCRDKYGAIRALKVRSQDDSGSRYTYVSSKAHGGPGPGSPLHWPLGDCQDSLRITEGELKADVAQYLSGVRTLALPGVASWRLALPWCLLDAEILLAFDLDVWSNPLVARNLLGLANALLAQGCEVVLEVWAGVKGIDDLLVSGEQPAVVRGKSLEEHLRWLAASYGWRQT